MLTIIRIYTVIRHAASLRGNDYRSTLIPRKPSPYPSLMQSAARIYLLVLPSATTVFYAVFTQYE